VATEPWYCTRESVKSALDVKETARNNSQVDEVIASSSRSIDGMMHRKFYPLTATRKFDWPNTRNAPSYRLWLDEYELASATSILSGGVAITAGQYFLEPYNDGPPYDRIDLNVSTVAAFNSGSTWQQSLVVVGQWAGCRIDEVPAGTVVEALDGTETGVDVSNSAAVGVGSVIRVDDERMVVTGSSMLDTGQNTGNSLTAQNNDVTVQVSNGSGFSIDEVILVDSERMLIVDIAGNNLTVKRAWDGSVLAAHNTNVDIYAPRTLTVERGALGTTAATHSTSTAISLWTPPALIQELCVATSVVRLVQRRAGYARVVGSGDNQRESSGRGLKQIQDEAKVAHARQLRHMAV
jgi:hypothetical protein